MLLAIWVGDDVSSLDSASLALPQHVDLIACVRSPLPSSVAQTVYGGAETEGIAQAVFQAMTRSLVFGDKIPAPDGVFLLRGDRIYPPDYFDTTPCMMWPEFVDWMAC